jgi:hypothetical protein
MSDAVSPRESTEISPSQVEDDHGSESVSIKSKTSVREVLANEDYDLESGRAKKHRSIHWPSPLCMVALSIVGVFSSVEHHIYYHSLDGQIVGNVNDQQNALRFVQPSLKISEKRSHRHVITEAYRLGTTFAFVTHLCLATSVGYSYIQWLWRSLKETGLTISGLDAAFAARTNILSLLNSDLLRELKVASLLVLISW